MAEACKRQWSDYLRVKDVLSGKTALRRACVTLKQLVPEDCNFHDWSIETLMRYFQDEAFWARIGELSEDK